MDETPQTDSQAKEPNRKGTVVALTVAGAVIVGLIVGLSGEEQVKSPPRQVLAVPSYCKEKAATYRLPECGVSAREAQEIDARPDKDRAAAEAMLRYFVQEAKSQCDKPLAKMSVEDVEDCKKPGMRWLRDQ
jgi:hypothetical protein